MNSVINKKLIWSFSSKLIKNKELSFYKTILSLSLKIYLEIDNNQRHLIYFQEVVQK